MINLLLHKKKEFNTAVDTISQSVPYGTECEREEYIHNYIINNCDYDEEAAENDDVQDNENDAYGVLVDGIGGDWYQIDVTWDDVDDFIYDSHEYFNLTDSLMYEEHTLSPKYSEIDAESF